MRRALCIAGSAALAANLGMGANYFPGVDPEILRGDATGDMVVNLADSIFIQNFLFLGGQAPTCFSAADANDDGRVDQSDSVYLMDFLFRGGHRPPLPNPYCGSDPTADDLTCVDSGCQ